MPHGVVCVIQVTMYYLSQELMQMSVWLFAHMDTIKIAPHTNALHVLQIVSRVKIRLYASYVAVITINSYLMAKSAVSVTAQICITLQLQ